MSAAAAMLGCRSDALGCKSAESREYRLKSSGRLVEVKPLCLVPDSPVSIAERTTANNGAPKKYSPAGSTRAIHASGSLNTNKWRLSIALGQRCTGAKLCRLC